MFDGCRVPGGAVLGEVGRGFDVANTWLGTTRLQVAASCLGRARRALDLAVRHAATRRQFGKTIGRNQGVAFKLADMATALESATWLTWRAAWLVDADKPADPAIAMAKLAATEMLASVADEALQIHGGMGLMDELVLERIWRDARVERIWDGTSEIQRHILSRSMLRARGGWTCAAARAEGDRRRRERAGVRAGGGAEPGVGLRRGALGGAPDPLHGGG